MSGEERLIIKVCNISSNDKIERKVLKMTMQKLTHWMEKAGRNDNDFVELAEKFGTTASELGKRIRNEDLTTEEVNKIQRLWNVPGEVIDWIFFNGPDKFLEEENWWIA